MRFSTLSAVAVLLSGVIFGVGCSHSDKSSQISQTQLVYQQAEQPRISGDWVGTWGVSGAPQNYQQRLDCRVVALSPDKWEATFEGECGRLYKYTIQMPGRQVGEVVLFKGSADLGKQDGGTYDWIGRATEEKFVGFYTSRKYTGTFEMTRPLATSERINENP